MFSVLCLSACESDDEGAEEKGPLVGLLELPLSHRHTDREPAKAAQVVVAPGEIQVNGETVLTLDGGKVPDAERTGHLLPKLKAKLSGQRTMALRVHGATPYATLARVIHTGLQSNVQDFYFQVRKPAATTETGWMKLSDVRLTDHVDPPVFEASEMPEWETFAQAWAEVRAGCKEDPAGDCAYVPSTKAKGGKLDMMLRSRGSGITVRFRQYLPEDAQEQEQAEEAPKAKGPAMLDGIAAPQPVEEEAEDPSTEAMFTLRHDQAARPESAFSSIVKPVCGDQACAAVIEAEGISLSARVISLIGAAFPDGTPEPNLALLEPPQ